MSDPHWFAIWTRSRHEKLVRDQLEKKHVEVFLPTIGKWSHWKDRKKKIDWPLFPGYCFARFDKDQRLDVVKCEGVVTVISNNGEMSPIPDIEIESIRTLVDSELAFDPVPLIKEGDMVKVTHGPLKGVVAARITQIMNLLVLAPDIQEEILFMPPVAKGPVQVTERDLRPLVKTLV